MSGWDSKWWCPSKQEWVWCPGPCPDGREHVRLKEDAK